MHCLHFCLFLLAEIKKLRNTKRNSNILLAHYEWMGSMKLTEFLLNQLLTGQLQDEVVWSYLNLLAKKIRLS